MPQRSILSIMCFLAVVLITILRVCLNVAIIPMTGRIYQNRPKSQMETYDWNEELQGIILGAFYWGCVSKVNKDKCVIVIIFLKVFDSCCR